MLRCTLIAAVRRIYEPGAKHDAACVLMGPHRAAASPPSGATSAVPFSLTRWVMSH
jgi:hypothetical protein